MTIGERIKKFRNEKKLTQKQLGEKCGIDEANIRKYELGKQNPKIETLRKIALALEVYTIDLLYDEEQSSEIKRQNFAELSMHYISKNLLELPNDVEITEDILLRNFNKLNKLGKTEAFKRIEELTEIERYIENDSSTLSNQQESSNLTKTFLED
ncbi:MAG: helix-turn-helix domain-containing protein [Lachnospiraceae bacterium]|nr:helix-turn-helix domain-containing protein [Lachnospiraceae bacterium]